MLIDFNKIKKDIWVNIVKVVVALFAPEAI